MARFLKALKQFFSKPLRLIITVLILAGVAVALYFLLRKPVPEPELPIVEVDEVVTEDVKVYGDYAGRIRAQHFVELHARVEGYIDEILCDEGKYIEKNQTLYVIDPTVYKAQAEKAAAKLNKAKAATLKAQRDLERIRPLFEQNAASRLDLDNAEAAYESAKADEAVSRAELTQAELTLSYTTVRTPISGIVTDCKVDIGSLVGPGGKSLLASVVSSDRVLIDFSMTALDYLKSKSRNVNIGERDSTRDWEPYITVTLADGTPYPYHGQVDFAEPKVDPKTGTFTVRAEMPNPEHVLLPGEFTRVRFLMDVRRDAVAVPSKALDIQKGGAYVYVVRPDSVVEHRYIETGPELDNAVVVERGLAPGERIITEGYHKVKHGIKVRPVLAADSVSSTVPAQ